MLPRGLHPDMGAITPQIPDDERQGRVLGDRLSERNPELGSIVVMDEVDAAASDEHLWRPAENVVCRGGRPVDPALEIDLEDDVEAVLRQEAVPRL